MCLGLLCVVEGGERVVQVHAQADQLGDVRPGAEAVVPQALRQLLPGPVRRLESSNGEPGNQRGEDFVKLLKVVEVAQNKGSLCVLLGKISAKES